LYALVGAHHSYVLPSSDSDLPDRKEIEERYADRVADAQHAYEEELASGQDPTSASATLKADCQMAAAERDEQYAAHFPRNDEVLTQYPDLRTDCDGPYQTIEVDYRLSGSVPIVLNYIVFVPWPGYPTYQNPFGWDYGVIYPPERFRRKYHSWRNSYAMSGRRSLFGLVGHRGPVLAANASGFKARAYAARRLPVRSSPGSVHGGASSSHDQYGRVAGVRPTRCSASGILWWRLAERKDR
jgi:hypothetical protein